MAEEQNGQRTSAQQVSLAATGQSINRLVQSNILELQKVRSAALKLQKRNPPLSESGQAEVQMILQSCDEAMEQMRSLSETVEQKFQ